MSKFNCILEKKTLSKEDHVELLNKVEPNELVIQARIWLKFSYISVHYWASDLLYEFLISLWGVPSSISLPIFSLGSQVDKYLEVKGKGKLNSWVLEHVWTWIIFLTMQVAFKQG